MTVLVSFRSAFNWLASLLVMRVASDPGSRYALTSCLCLELDTFILAVNGNTASEPMLALFALAADSVDVLERCSRE